MFLVRQIHRNWPSVRRSRNQLARRRRIACLSAAPWNPYLRLLYGHLAAQGFEVVENPQFSLGWLWRARSSVGFLHFHWPESLYRYGRGPARLRPLLSSGEARSLRSPPGAARLLGYRLVWTIHQVFPHESFDRALDRRGARLLARACHLLIAHDHWTASDARSELGEAPEEDRRRAARLVHRRLPGGLPRREVRSELGLPQDSFVFLCFGELRAYKEIELLLEAFSSAPLPEARLLVAGNAKIASVASAVRAASANDSRILSVLGFVPDERVAELFHACDAAVLPRGDGGTSGSLILALSMGLPVVAADVPTVRELTRDGDAGWLFRPHELSSLRTSLERAGADPSEAARRADARSRSPRSSLDWSREGLAELLDQTKARGLAKDRLADFRSSAVASNLVDVKSGLDHVLQRVLLLYAVECSFRQPGAQSRRVRPSPPYERLQVSRRNEKAVFARPIDYFGNPPAGSAITGRPHAIAWGRMRGAASSRSVGKRNASAAARNSGILSGGCAPRRPPFRGA